MSTLTQRGGIHKRIRAVLYNSGGDFMPKKGCRKYRCEECQEESFHHWIERNRAARLRCPGCGSARMDLVTAEARADAADLQGVRVAGHPDMTRPPGEPDSRRKVTGG